MSNKKELQIISASEAARLGVSALSVRPNDASRYGRGGLSATALQAWFDNLPKLVATKFNEIAMTLASSEAAKYIGIDALGVDNLYDLLLLFGERGTGINDRNISDYIKTLYTPEGAVDAVSISIKDIVQDLVSRIVSASAGHVVSGSFDAVKGEILLKLASGEDIVIPFDVLADLKERSDKAFSEASLDKSNQLVLSSPDGSQKKVDLSPLAFGEAARVEIEKLKETDASFDRRLTNLEEQISDDYFVTDDAVAYEKIVPARACTYAKLNSLGGMTYKCDNLLDYRRFNATYTDSGVTLTNNRNGTLTFSGTLGVDTYSSRIPIFEGECYIPAGTYTFSGFSELPTVAYREFVWVYASGEADATSNLGAVTFTDNVVELYLAIILEGNVEVTETFSTTFTPMLNEGSTALPFEPFSDELRDTKVTEIKSHGGNHANIRNFENFDTTTSNSSFTVKDDTITISTPIENSSDSKKTLREICPSLKVGDVCTLTADTTSKNKYIYLNVAATSWLFGATKTITQAMLDSKIRFYTDAIGASAVISKFMITYGDVALSYKPFREPISYPIPAEIQAINTGKGIKGYADTDDFESGILTKRVATKTFNGNDNNDGYWWKYTEDGGKYCYAILMTGKAWGYQTSICNLFKNINTSFSPSYPYFYVGNYSDTPGGDGVYFVTDKPTLEEWKAYLKELYDAGTPLTLVYALLTPTEEKFSVDFDNIIEVEAGGRLEFVNEHKKPVPSSITYLLKEESSK